MQRSTPIAARVIALSFVCLATILILLAPRVPPSPTHKTNPRTDDIHTPFPGAANLRLNFDGPCGEVFRYRPHSGRDLVLVGFDLSWNYADVVGYKTFWRVETALKLLRAAMPNVSLVCLSRSAPTPSMRVLATRNNMSFAVYGKYKAWMTANMRVKAAAEFLDAHRAAYDRVVFADLRDVYYFGDVFATFGPTELAISVECFKNATGNLIRDKSATGRWIKQLFGSDTLRQLKNKKAVILNAGFVAGPTDRVLSLLRAWAATLHTKHAREWGYEQAALNVLLHTGAAERLGVSFVHCEQRHCYLPQDLVFGSDAQGIFDKNGCSPVSIHKGLPASWEMLG